MIREQAILKVAGNEVPLIALDSWQVWLLIGIACVFLWKWMSKRGA